MADRLVSPEELASFLRLTWTDLSTVQQDSMRMLVELATGKVQAAAGQRLVDTTSTALIDVDLFDCGPWLALPQSPIRSVASVLIDGVADASWLLRSQQLWRLNGWNTNSSAPTQVTVTFTHGYLEGTQALQLARDMVFSLAGAGYDDPAGVVQSEQIDDYRVTYAKADAQMQISTGARDLLRATYGVQAYITGSR